jgi:hypothetical protein
MATFTHVDSDSWGNRPTSTKGLVEANQVASDLRLALRQQILIRIHLALRVEDGKKVG